MLCGALLLIAHRLREDARAAALIIGDPEILLGRDFVRDSKVTVQLLSKECLEAKSVVGFRLVFPVEASPSNGDCYSEAGQNSLRYTITVKFPHNQFLWSAVLGTESRPKGLSTRLCEGRDISKLRSVLFSIEEGLHVEVDGFGKPYVGGDTELSSWLNLDSPICGSIALSEILSSRRFRFLIPNEDGMRKFLKACAGQPPNWQGYPFGKIHTFDMKRYRRIIPKNEGFGYEAHWRFDDVEDFVTCVSQPHIQDVFYFHEDIVGLSGVNVKAALLPVDSNDSEVWAVLNVTERIDNVYAATWRRLMKSAYPFAVVVKPNHGDQQSIWDAKFSISSNVAGMNQPWAIVLHMKIRSPRRAGQKMTRFKTWEQVLNSELHD
ncbi:hypothetical protein JDV02_005760 [Purpureocillium takamizusanense]|uniref:Uncharacterized protein n=1 Tax=Purpureocillium takamizusanense TaxID=2060973 RepID=A0A9Q8VAN2_9HYPO|nr:uncharacterized protein JDV02_005760 [Purpureocillium takamizusanense]UNI19580.1 hypothetical protein JDV02_005760 [Purpureocillium takamizusanense]